MEMTDLWGLSKELDHFSERTDQLETDTAGFKGQVWSTGDISNRAHATVRRCLIDSVLLSADFYPSALRKPLARRLSCLYDLFCI